MDDKDDTEQKRLERNAYMRKWSAEHKEDVSEWSKAYREAHPEKIAELKRAYYERKKEQVKARAKAWKAANPEKVKEGQRRYAAAHKAEILAKTVAWQKANPDKVRVIQRRSDAKRRGRYERYKMTQEDYARMLKAQGGCCALCGSADPRSRSKRFVVDHDHSCCPSHMSTCGECVRALLCCPCNRALGLLKDSAELLEKAVSYVRNKGKQPSLWQIAANGEASLSPELLL